MADLASAFDNDWRVLFFFTFLMCVGGVVFASVFSAATGLFEAPQDKASAATAMNVLYYVGIAVASATSLLLRRGWK